jgi:hypothetical protein
MLKIKKIKVYLYSFFNLGGGKRQSRQFRPLVSNHLRDAEHCFTVSACSPGSSVGIATRLQVELSEVRNPTKVVAYKSKCT